MGFNTEMNFSRNLRFLPAKQMILSVGSHWLCLTFELDISGHFEIIIFIYLGKITLNSRLLMGKKFSITFAFLFLYY